MVFQLLYQPLSQVIRASNNQLIRGDSVVVEVQKEVESRLLNEVKVVNDREARDSQFLVGLDEVKESILEL